MYIYVKFGTQLPRKKIFFYFSEIKKLRSSVQHQQFALATEINKFLKTFQIFICIFKINFFLLQRERISISSENTRQSLFPGVGVVGSSRSLNYNPGICIRMQVRGNQQLSPKKRRKSLDVHKRSIIHTTYT